MDSKAKETATLESIQRYNKTTDHVRFVKYSKPDYSGLLYFSPCGAKPLVSFTLAYAKKVKQVTSVRLAYRHVKKLYDTNLYWQYSQQNCLHMCKADLVQLKTIKKIGLVWPLIKLQNFLPMKSLLVQFTKLNGLRKSLDLQ